MEGGVQPELEHGSSPLARLSPLLVFALALILYLPLFLLLPAHSIWISDEGNRVLSVKSYADGAWGALPNPASKMEPSLSSYPPPYFYKGAKGDFRSGYSQLFPLAAAPAWKLAGLWGARLIPLVAGLLCALLALLVARELGGSDQAQSLAVVACFLGTPLCFYSFVLLEITLAAALWSLSTLLVLRCLRAGGMKPGLLLALTAGAAAGASTAFREEGYIGLAAALAGLAVCRAGWRPCLAFAAGAGLLLAPLWAFNLFDSGSVFGIHAKIYASLNPGHGLSSRLLAVPSNLWFFLLKPHFDVAFPLCLAALPLGFAAYAGLRGSAGLRALALLLCVAAAFASFLSQALNPELLAATLRHQSLWESLPLAALPLLFLRELWTGRDRGLRFLGVSTALFLLGSAALLDSRSAGVFWGARHLLLAAPALCALAACLPWLSGSTLLRWGALALLAVSLLVQSNGIQMLWEKRAHSESVLRGLPPSALIATDVFWLPEEFAADPQGRTVVFIRSSPDLVRLLEACKAKGIPSFTLAMSPLFSGMHLSTREWLRNETDVRESGGFETPGLSILDLVAYNCVLKP